MLGDSEKEAGDEVGSQDGEGSTIYTGDRQAATR